MTRTTTAKDRMPMISLSSPSTPRLRTVPAGSRRTLLDGGWWPRSTDPVAELPGLVLAIDKLHGPVTRLVLSIVDWDSRPGRLGVAGRVLRLAYFTSQPSGLLTALCENGDRVDLLVIPPQTARETADAAMILAATTSNLTHAQHILHTASTANPRRADSEGEDTWEGEGGRLWYTPPPAGICPGNSGSRNQKLRQPANDNLVRGTKPRHIDVGRSQDSDTALSGGDSTVSGQAAETDRQ